MEIGSIRPLLHRGIFRKEEGFCFEVTGFNQSKTNGEFAISRLHHGDVMPVLSGGGESLIDEGDRFRPPDCGKLHMKSERFAGQASRLWWYELTLTCAGVLVEAMEEEDMPVLTDIDFEGGTS